MCTGVSASCGDRITLRTSGEEYIVEEERDYFLLLFGNSQKRTSQVPLGNNVTFYYI